MRGPAKSCVHGALRGLPTREPSRCDRPGARNVTAADDETYVVCSYHARQGWAASVARWHEESGVRASAPTDLATHPRLRRLSVLPQREAATKGFAAAPALPGASLVAVIPEPGRRGPRGLYRQSRSVA